MLRRFPWIPLAALLALILLSLPVFGRFSAQESLEKPPMPKDEFETQVLKVLQSLDQDRRGHMNVPENDGRLLRLLIESSGAKTVVEIGTSNGYSGIWMCLGLHRTGGRLITHEIDPERAEWARTNFKKAGVWNMVTLIEGDAHETVKDLKGPIDLLFIDADKPGYVDYLQKCLPKVRPGGLILGHNMNRPAPNPAFVKAITENPALETLFVHMDAAGMAITMKKR